MSQIFSLPDVGEGLTEAEILSWKVSNRSKRSPSEQCWSRLRPRRASSNCPRPSPHRRNELMVAEGETVEVGTPIIRISVATARPGRPRRAAAGDRIRHRAGRLRTQGGRR